jgi:hypothetical protein
MYPTKINAYVGVKAKNPALDYPQPEYRRAIEEHEE